jgi:hypothetical protein
MAVASCAIRVKYSALPKLRASSASFYSRFLEGYSFLQYNQASTEEGKTALLVYLGELQTIQNGKIEYPEKSLHFDSALTYLRLYRLELLASNATKAEEYLSSAQHEFAMLGQKNVSTESLIKAIETREIGEARIYNGDKGVTGPMVGQKP